MRGHLRPRIKEVGQTLAAALIAAATVSAQMGPRSGDFAAFESGPVRPLALSSDGRRLFAVNTPDARLEVFVVTRAGLAHRESIPVGLEPVAVSVVDESQVWVVNHLSDSVSVVDVSSEPGRVSRTLFVGDEPRDIVFAGPGGRRALPTLAGGSPSRVRQDQAFLSATCRAAPATRGTTHRELRQQSVLACA